MTHHACTRLIRGSISLRLLLLWQLQWLLSVLISFVHGFTSESSSFDALMSASPELIRQLCKIDDTQMQIVKEVLEQFRQDKQISFNDAFAQAPELQNTLKQHFSFSESGYYTLSIRPASNSGIPGRLLSISIAIRAFIPPTGLRYHNWQLH